MSVALALRNLMTNTLRPGFHCVDIADKGETWEALISWDEKPGYGTINFDKRLLNAPATDIGNYLRIKVLEIKELCDYARAKFQKSEETL